MIERGDRVRFQWGDRELIGYVISAPGETGRVLVGICPQAYQVPVDGLTPVD